jgi:DNA-binding transcriptional LysR family regulator
MDPRRYPPSTETILVLHRNLDLNSLECFDVLMRERNVSRAAERLGLSQSSMSEALARLRERFGDPLLVRGREGMVATPRAQALLPDVRAAIDRLQSLLANEAFNPGEAALRFRLTASDYTQLLLMPALHRLMREQAPLCNVDVLPVHLLRIEEHLDRGDIDLAIAYHPEPPPGLRRSPLFDDTYVCVARPGHAAIDADMDAHAYAALSHISVAPSGITVISSVVDSALETRGLTRRVAVSSPHFLLAAYMVSQSDLVLSLPRRAAVALTAFLPLQMVEIPLAMRSIDLAMYWHERTHASPSHRWLREQVKSILLASA